MAEKTESSLFAFSNTFYTILCIFCVYFKCSKHVLTCCTAVVKCIWFSKKYVLSLCCISIPPFVLYVFWYLQRFRMKANSPYVCTSLMPINGTSSSHAPATNKLIHKVIYLLLIDALHLYIINGHIIFDVDTTVNLWDIGDRQLLHTVWLEFFLYTGFTWVFRDRQTLKLTVNTVNCFDDAQPSASSLIWRGN